MSENPEMDYFMNESVSDVIFVVEGQRIPAMKSILSLKSKVFRTMFSGNFKEAKDKEVVIEETTYEAFKTFIRFIYCDDLVLKEDIDFELIGELYKLCDRYDVSRLADRITDKLYEISVKLFTNGESFGAIWLKIQWISRIGFGFKIEKLMNIVMEFIRKKFEHFVDLNNEHLIELNDSTDGRLFPLMADKCFEFWDELNDLKERIYSFKHFDCDKCQSNNEVLSYLSKRNCQNCRETVLKRFRPEDL